MAKQQTETAGKQHASTMNPVAWFEIPTTDIERAQDFYETVLQIKMEKHQLGPLKMAFFPMQSDGSGATGSLVEGGGYRPSTEGTVVYFSTDDIPAALDRAVDAGGQVLQPKTSIGEYGFIAMIRDTEGNRIALHSMK